MSEIWASETGVTLWKDLEAGDVVAGAAGSNFRGVGVVLRERIEARAVLVKEAMRVARKSF